MSEVDELRAEVARLRAKVKQLRDGPVDDLSYVFVMTYGRSGSTLLMGLLNTIPGYLIRGENDDALRFLHDFHRTCVERSTYWPIDRVRRKTDAFYGIGDFPPALSIADTRRLAVDTLLRPEAGHAGHRLQGDPVVAPRGPRRLRRVAARGLPRRPVPGQHPRPRRVLKSKWWAKGGDHSRPPRRHRAPPPGDRRPPRRRGVPRPLRRLRRRPRRSWPRCSPGWARSTTRPRYGRPWTPSTPSERSHPDVFASVRSGYPVGRVSLPSVTRNCLPVRGSNDVSASLNLTDRPSARARRWSRRSRRSSSEGPPGTTTQRRGWSTARRRAARIRCTTRSRSSRSAPTTSKGSSPASRNRLSRATSRRCRSRLRCTAPLNSPTTPDGHVEQVRHADQPTAQVDERWGCTAEPASRPPDARSAAVGPPAARARARRPTSAPTARRSARAGGRRRGCRPSSAGWR